jgi:hypothetical protein
MNLKKLDQFIQDADIIKLHDVLKVLLKPHASPVFGAVKVIEHEIAALNALRMLGYLASNADEYSLVEGLRVTKAKARSLLYNSALRQMDDESEVDAQLRLIVGRCILCKDGDMFLFEVPQPLTMDRFRQRVRKLGFISDGTFSGSVARIPGDALVALVEALMPMPEAQKKSTIKKLHAAGYEGKDFASIIKRVAISAASTVGGKVAGYLAEETANVLWPFLTGKFDQPKS